MAYSEQLGGLFPSFAAGKRLGSGNVSQYAAKNGDNGIAIPLPRLLPFLLATCFIRQSPHPLLTLRFFSCEEKADVSRHASLAIHNHGLQAIARRGALRSNSVARMERSAKQLSGHGDAIRYRLSLPVPRAGAASLPQHGMPASENLRPSRHQRGYAGRDCAVHDTGAH